MRVRLRTALSAASKAAIEYSTDLFELETVEAIAARLVALFESAIAAPDQLIGRIDLLDAAERHRVLVEWNDTGVPCRRRHCRP